MSGLIRIALATVAALIVAAAAYFAYLGGFSKVEARRGTFGPAEITFAPYVGPYREIAAAWTALTEKTEAAGLTRCDALALYLDPPGTPEDKLRTAIACRIDDVAPAVRDALGAELALTVLPETTTYTAAFPYKSPASYFLGPQKAYPALSKAIPGGPEASPVAIEVYGVAGEATSIIFHMPVETGADVYAEVFAAFE